MVRIPDPLVTLIVDVTRLVTATHLLRFHVALRHPKFQSLGCWFRSPCVPDSGDYGACD